MNPIPTFLTLLAKCAKKTTHNKKKRDVRNGTAGLWRPCRVSRFRFQENSSIMYLLIKKQATSCRQQTEE